MFLMVSVVLPTLVCFVLSLSSLRFCHAGENARQGTSPGAPPRGSSRMEPGKGANGCATTAGSISTPATLHKWKSSLRRVDLRLRFERLPEQEHTKTTI